LGELPQRVSCTKQNSMDALFCVLPMFIDNPFLDIERDADHENDEYTVQNMKYTDMMEVFKVNLGAKLNGRNSNKVAPIQLKITIEKEPKSFEPLRSMKPMLSSAALSFEGIWEEAMRPELIIDSEEDLEEDNSDLSTIRPHILPSAASLEMISIHEQEASVEQVKTLYIDYECVGND